MVLPMLLSKLSHLTVERTGFIGLELGPERLHMLQMESGADGMTVRAAISQAYPDGRAAFFANRFLFKSFIAKALKSRPFKGRQVVSCLPPGEVKIMTLTYHQAEGQTLIEALSRELRERLKEELEQSVVDYLPVRSDGSQGEKNVLVAVARRERVMDYLALLSSAGLEVVALDIGPAAISRLVAHLGREGAHPNVMLINFGRAKSYLSVIWGKRLMLDREIDFGEAQLLARIGKTLNIGEDLASQLLYQQGLYVVGGSGKQESLLDREIAQTITEVLRHEFGQLADEVTKTLIYTASKTRGSSVEKVYLLGSAARYPNVALFMQGLLAIPVEALNPLASLRFGKKAAEMSALEPVAGMALATGLALRERNGNGGN